MNSAVKTLKSLSASSFVISLSYDIIKFYNKIHFDDFSESLKRTCLKKTQPINIQTNAKTNRKVKPTKCNLKYIQKSNYLKNRNVKKIVKIHKGCKSFDNFPKLWHNSIWNKLSQKVTSVRLLEDYFLKLAWQTRAWRTPVGKRKIIMFQKEIAPIIAPHIILMRPQRVWLYLKWSVLKVGMHPLCKKIAVVKGNTKTLIPRRKTLTLSRKRGNISKHNWIKK